MVVAQPPTVAAATIQAASDTSWTSYVVRSGDTLDALARRYHTTVSVLAAHNRLANPHWLSIGQRLSVPGAAKPTAKPATKAASTPSPRQTATTAAPQASKVHVVRSGDTLSGIAQRYGVSLAALLKTNRIPVRSFIHPGQRLSIPSRGAAPKPAPTKAAPAKRPTVASTFLGTRYPPAITQSATRNKAILDSRPAPSRAEVKALIIEIAQRHGVDPKLALAIGFQESGWNQRAVSPANAVGVMQLIPAGGEWSSELVGRRLDLLDARDNITAGVVMLRALGQATSSTEMAVGAYYQGLYSVRTKGLYGETQRYVANVLALRTRM
jgi:LysM repeat protein